LILPCEVGVKTILPAVKAIMARSIVEGHKISEKQTAEILGLSQSAISRYINHDRGNLLEIEKTAEIVPLIEQMVNLLVYEPVKKMEIIALFCQVCQKVREKGLMCPLCQKEMRKDWADACSFCR
jgi:uncharacterized protein